MARTGRPKLEDPHNYKLTVRFSKEQRKRLEAYAEKFSLSKAQVAERLTLNDMFDKYIDQKYDLKATTKVNYRNNTF